MRNRFTAAAVCVAVGLLLAGGAQAAARNGPRAGGRNAPQSVADAVSEQQALMVKECKLSDEQQKAVKEKFAAKQAALEAWDKANGEKLKAADEAAKAARKGTDAAAKKTAGDALKALNEARTAAAAEADKAILAVLSEQQKVQWAGVELAQATLPRYNRANLTDEQAAKVRSACAIAAEDLAGLTGDDKKAKQGRVTVQKSLKWAIDNVILTPEQRAIVVRKPAAPAAPAPGR